MSNTPISNQTPPSIQGNVYRFKLSESILDKMKYFGKLHQFDDRKDFREAYDEWYLKEKEDIDRELSRLQKWGYDGDIKKKMYRSIRYYFNKKPNTRESGSKIEGNDKTEKGKRQYRRLPIEIQSRISSKLASSSYDQKPSELFKEFVRDNPDIFENCSEEDKARIKKSFKNIHFNFRPKESIQRTILVSHDEHDRID